MRKPGLILLIAFITTNLSGAAYKQLQARADTSITVPLGGNVWRTDADTTGGNINNYGGIINWTNKAANFTAYVRFARKGKFKLWLTGRLNGGKSKIAVSALNRTKVLSFEEGVTEDHYAGEWVVTDTGYVAFHIKGINKTDEQFAFINDLVL